LLDEQGIEVSCEVKVFPLLVKRQSESWPELEQRLVQWVEPAKAVLLIKERQLKRLVSAFAKRITAATRKSSPRKAGMKPAQCSARLAVASIVEDPTGREIAASNA
jgi:hypothetical protein